MQILGLTQQPLNETRALVDQVLAVVENEQGAVRAKVLDQRLFESP